MNNSDQEFEQRVRTNLESGVAHLDAEARSRLALARTRALEYKPFWSNWISFEHWVPVAAFASLAIVSLTLVFQPNRHDAPAQLAQQDGDVALEVLLNEDGHEEVADPDFYVWLDITLMEDEEPGNAG
jgi:hypothetical protein